MIKTQTVVIDKMTFDVTLAGDSSNPPVLFLHGFPQTNYTWRHQLPFLAEAGYYCIAPNQRGYSAGARPTGIDQYATSILLQDMLSLMDQLALSGNQIHSQSSELKPKVHIVGHDWGGQLSWLLAAFHPDRVKSLSVLSRPHPAAFIWAMQQDAKQANRSKHHRAFQDDDSAKLLLADNARRLRKMYADQWVSDTDIEAYLEILGSHEALNSAINWYRTRSDGTALVGDSVPPVNIPTLYLWGREDATVGRLAAEKTRDFVAAEFTFVEIPEVGHFITDQVIKEVNDNLLLHLNKVESSI